MGSGIKLKFFRHSSNIKVFCSEAFVNLSARNSFTSKSTYMCDFLTRNIFIHAYRQVTTTLILLSILLTFDIIKLESQLKTVIWTIKQIHAEFSYKYFIGTYKQLTLTFELITCRV